MGAEETLLDAGLVIGGLWDEAPIESYGVQRTWDSLQEARRNLYWDIIDGVDGVSLVLPGNLGLGAAGLAARIAERTGSDSPEYGDKHIPVKGHDLPLYGKWRDVPVKPLALASEYLVATDALCASVGLKLEDGEVAEWKWLNGFWWLVTKTDRVGVVFHGDPAKKHDGKTHVYVKGCPTTGDKPLPSLRATWEEVCNNG